MQYKKHKFSNEQSIISQVNLRKRAGWVEGGGEGGGNTIHQLSNLPVSNIYLIEYRSIFLFFFRTQCSVTIQIDAWVLYFSYQVVTTKYMGS